jgi:hypothetical protein
MHACFSLKIKESGVYILENVHCIPGLNFFCFLSELHIHKLCMSTCVYMVDQLGTLDVTCMHVQKCTFVDLLSHVCV